MRYGLGIQMLPVSYTHLVANVTPLCTDILAYTPAEKFDAMVFCFFGSMEEILAAALRQCRGTVLAVVRDDVCHRFSGAPRAPGRHSFDAACGVLDALGIPYTAQRAALDFPQPFRTLEDARTFLTLYGGGAPAEDDLRTKLDVYKRQEVHIVGKLTLGLGQEGGGLLCVDGDEHDLHAGGSKGVHLGGEVRCV